MHANNLSSKISVWLATGMGVGLVSPAPGTIGGLWGLPLSWAVLLLPSVDSQALAIVAIGLVSVFVCSAAAEALGGTKDPQSIVLDEIAALPIVYLGVAMTSVFVWLTGWLLFRLFDITKPPPTRQFERLPGGLGIMADDWVAAVEACVCLHLLIWIDSAAGWQLINASS